MLLSKTVEIEMDLLLALSLLSFLKLFKVRRMALQKRRYQLERAWKQIDVLKDKQGSTTLALSLNMSRPIE